MHAASCVLATHPGEDHAHFAFPNVTVIGDTSSRTGLSRPGARRKDMSCAPGGEFGGNRECDEDLQFPSLNFISNFMGLGGLLRVGRARHARTPRDVAVFFVPVDGALERGLY